MSTQSGREARLNPYKHKDRRGERSARLPDVSLTRLAEVMGMNRSHLSKVLNGQSGAGLKLLGRLQEALGLESLEQVTKWLTRVQRIQKKK